MHCSQVSSGAASVYQKQGAKVAGCGEAKPVQRNDDCGPAGGCDDSPKPKRSEGGHRPNPLVSAMMEALKGLMSPTGTTAAAGTPATDAPAAGAPVAAAPGATTAAGASGPKDSVSTLTDAVNAFANELLSALKSAGESSGVFSSPGAAGYGKTKGYDNFAAALQRLAQTLVPSTSPATTTVTPPGAADKATTQPVSARAPRSETLPYTPTVKAPPPPPEWSTAGTATPAIKAPPPPPEWSTAGAPYPSVAVTTAPAPVTNGAAAGSPITVNISITLGGGAAASSSSQSPLLAAFKQLVSALNPSAGDASGATSGEAGTSSAQSPEQMLQAFLLKMAKSLDSGPAKLQPYTPMSGSLLSTVA